MLKRPVAKYLYRFKIVDDVASLEERMNNTGFKEGFWCGHREEILIAASDDKTAQDIVKGYIEWRD